MPTNRTHGAHVARYVQCARCGVNVSGTVLHREHPATGMVSSLCVRCAETPDVCARCHGCSSTFYPGTAMRLRGGLAYCVECDPVERVECMSCSRQVRRDTALLFNWESEERRYCHAGCANRDNFRFRSDGNWDRVDENTGTSLLSWTPRPGRFVHRPGLSLSPLSFGVEIEALIDAAPAGWKVVRDGSLPEAGQGNFNPWEMVSPILRGNEGAASLGGALDAMSGHFRRARNAGFHVHVGVEDLLGKHLHAIFDHWETWGEDFASGLVTKARFARKYCQPMRNGEIAAMVRRRIQRDETVGVLRDRLRSSERFDRYWTLNPCSVAKHGTVEFRLWSCTTVPETIEGWTAFCVNFVSAVIRDRFPRPSEVREAVEARGVMRTGMRLLRAEPAFATWIARRWRYLCGQNSLSPNHRAREDAEPWGSPPRFPLTVRGQREQHVPDDEPVEVEETTPADTTQNQEPEAVTFSAMPPRPMTEMLEIRQQIDALRVVEERYQRHPLRSRARFGPLADDFGRLDEPRHYAFTAREMAQTDASNLFGIPASAMDAGGAPSSASQEAAVGGGDERLIDRQFTAHADGTVTREDRVVVAGGILTRTFDHFGTLIHNQFDRTEAFGHERSIDIMGRPTPPL